MPLEQRVSSPHLCNTTWSRLERLIHHVLNVPPLNSAIPKPNIFGYRALVPSSVSVLNTFWKLLWAVGSRNSLGQARGLPDCPPLPAALRAPGLLARPWSMGA